MSDRFSQCTPVQLSGRSSSSPQAQSLQARGAQAGSGGQEGGPGRHQERQSGSSKGGEVGLAALRLGGCCAKFGSQAGRRAGEQAGGRTNVACSCTQAGNAHR